MGEAKARLQCGDQGRGDAERLRERAGSCKEQRLQERWGPGGNGESGKIWKRLHRIWNILCTGYGMTGRVEYACSVQGLGRGRRARMGSEKSGVPRTWTVRVWVMRRQVRGD